jgi:hypothetical protein
MVLFSVTFSIATAAENYTYVSQAGADLPWTEVTAWLAVWAISPVVTIVTWMVALFPSGVLQSTWLRWPLGVSLALAVIGLVGRAVLPVEMTLDGMAFVNPWGVESLAWLVPIEEAGYTLVLVVLAFAAVDLVMRWRRSTGVERLQMRALALTLAIFAGGVALLSLLQLLDLPRTVMDTLETLVWVPGLALLPVAIGVAVLRYRLYEIDRLVSRTVSYAVVVSSLALLFLGGVTVLTSLLPAQSDVAVAASTLAVAALFNPLRRRVQAWVDARFNRARYDSEIVVGRFVGSLRDQVDLETVVDGWIDVVDETMQPASVAVWIRDVEP